MRVVFNAPTKAIPGNATRKKLVFVNTGTTTVYWGWESTVVKDASNYQGIPLAANDGMIIDGNDRAAQPVYFDSTAGIINYTENQ
jgi:hypothetical protein